MSDDDEYAVTGVPTPLQASLILLPAKTTLNEFVNVVVDDEV